MATTDRYREGLSERLGRVPARLRTFLAATVSSSPKVGSAPAAVWLHAVSVGEVLAATRLVSELEKNYRVVISTTTRTGQHLARARFGTERVFYFPFDFAFAIRPYLDLLQPQALILMESELWPRLLHECAARNIPVVVANARVSDRSFARSLRFRKLWQRLAQHVTLWLAQSAEDARRLTTLLTLPNPVILSEASRLHRDAQSKDPEAANTTATSKTFSPQTADIRVTGNLKYDILAPQQSHIATFIREAAGIRPIIVAGSTTESGADEEHLILDAWQGQARAEHHALLVLAPRHPERFEKVFALTQPYQSIRATDLNASQPQDIDIIVLNTIGDLASVYSVADIAFVGGSLVPRGGHNPLEPAQFGVPVLMGESFENFRDIVTAMRHADAILCDLHPETLEAALLDLLANPDDARALGERGRQVFLQQQGATTRTVEAILSLLAPTLTPSAVATPMAPASNLPAPSAPTARLIPAWGEAPGAGTQEEQRAESPPYSSQGKPQ